MKEKLVEGVTASGRPVVVYQLRLEHVIGLGEKIAEEAKRDGGLMLTTITRNFFELVSKSTSLSEKEFKGLTFEDIENVEKAWREVNAPLFRYLQRTRQIPPVEAWVKNLMAAAEVKTEIAELAT